MINKIFKLLTLTLILFTFASCNDEYLFDKEFPGEGDDYENELPVEFIIYGPEENNTRASETQKPRFFDGDVIHIQGNFRRKDNKTSSAYGVMKFNAGKWEPIEGSTLKWPFDAEKGTFKAFYVPLSNGLLTPGTHTDYYLLSQLDASYNSNGNFDLDPLTASTLNEEYDYGHAVELNFTHALSHLTFINMETGVSDNFWLFNLNENEQLNNAYALELDENNELKLIYSNLPANMYGPEPYVSGKAIISLPESGTGISKVKTSYFLKPGDYSNIELRTTNNSAYLSLKSDETGNLQPNIPYIVDVEKSKGINFTIKDDEIWNDKGPYEVVVKDFIEAVVNGTEYTVKDENQNDIRILEPINNGVRLLRNISFPDEQEDYDKIWSPNQPNGFSPNIPSGRVFEGDHYYISNIKKPLFHYNAGTIQNLGLKDIDCEVISKYEGPENDYKKDRSRQGGVCLWNREGGSLYNLRIENLEITVKINVGNITHSHYAGGICGDNDGKISDISLGGKIKIKVKNNENRDSQSVDSEISIGGLTGHNTGTLRRISPIDNNLQVNIVNSCIGEGGRFNVGGAVGYNAAVMENISLPNVSVDCSQSDCYQAYTGGLVGRLRGSATQNSVINSTVGGIVKAGHVSDYGNYTDSYMYTGGLVGSCLMFIVSDCVTTCNVDGNSGDLELNSRYCTGGIFGSILTTDDIDYNNISNITGWNSEITGPSDKTKDEYIGLFAGIVPSDKNWEFYQASGITVKQNGSWPEIGESMNVAAGGVSED